MVRVAARDEKDLEQATSGRKHLVLVLDSHTLKIVSSVCRRYELADQGVLFIEQIEKPRQPFPDLDVVYFLSEESSLSHVLKDHEAPLYRYSHAFFSAGRLSESAFSRLTSSREFVARCKNLVEMNLDYVSFEPRVFHADSPSAIRTLADASAESVQQHVNCLVSVCASLGEKPVIRYMADSVSTVSQRVALGLRRETDELAKSAEGKLKANGTTVLILDRSIETAGLFVHDFFYQALALDVLDGVEGCGVQWALGVTEGDKEQAMSVVPSFTYKSVNGKGVEDRKQVILSEADPLWVRFRRDHFRVVSDAISREISTLAKTSDLAKLAKGDPLELLRGIPEYQDQIAKLSVHVELSRKLIEAFDKLGLMDIAKLEQELATGVDDDGKEVICGKIFNALSLLCQDGRVGPEERLRLVLLYLSQVDDVSESTAQDLVRKVARLDPDLETAVVRFLALGLHGTRTAPALLPDGPMGKVQPVIQANRHSMKQLSRLQIRNKMKQNKTTAKNSKFVNCRFTSELKDVGELALNNQLDLASYPAVGGTGISSYSPTGGETGTSAAALWGQGVGTKTARQKIIVFVLGGITLGEAREMAELEAKFGIDVLLGGSAVLTPKRLIEILLTQTVRA